MPLQGNPPAQLQQKTPEIHQESNGPNSPNIVTGNNSTVTIGGAQVSGVILPSNGARPAMTGPADSPYSKPIPAAAMLLQLGNNLAFSTNLTEASFTALRIGDENMVTVNQVGEGINLNARVYSPDGRIVADIDNNEFSVNPNNYFKIKRPDRSTFSVYNQFGEEALSVSFVARAYMVIAGTFYKPGYLKVTANREAVIQGPLTLSRVTTIFSNHGVAFGLGVRSTK